jgi:hypothetical protein
LFGKKVNADIYFDIEKVLFLDMPNSFLNAKKNNKIYPTQRIMLHDLIKTNVNT